jgi:hypothetical protein
MKLTPCAACPFRRDSLPGYLGEATGDPQSFVFSIWSEAVRQPCHLAVDWESSSAQREARRAPLCRGALIAMRNCAKMPVDAEVGLAVRNTDPDRETVFSHIGEFIAHHTVVLK